METAETTVETTPLVHSFWDRVIEERKIEKEAQEEKNKGRIYSGLGVKAPSITTRTTNG